jgi:hypothetical protein
MKYPAMKHQALQHALAAAALLLVSLGSASAQFSVNGGGTRYNPTREFNPYRMNFSTAWDMPLQDPVKLIDIAPVLNDRETSLLLLVDSQAKSDYRRKLMVTHWDGQRLINDTSIDFFGTTLDSLLVGHFRVVTKPTAVVTPVTDKKAKRPAPPPTRQVATTEGIYQWTGGTFARLYSSPPGLKLALTLEGAQDQMLINAGDNTRIYEAGDTDVHPSEFELTGDEVGYPHNGVGTQLYDGLKEFLPSVRYVQTYWNTRYHWQIGVLRGKLNANLTNPDATTGDRLVVYVPKAETHDRPFWQLMRTDQYEESWRSPVIPGRILDVRVGDPRREGKIGILVLTAENDDRNRHLYFYAPIEGTRPR